jgi:hypothetical protein
MCLRTDSRQLWRATDEAIPAAQNDDEWQMAFVTRVRPSRAWPRCHWQESEELGLWPARRRHPFTTNDMLRHLKANMGPTNRPWLPL